MANFSDLLGALLQGGMSGSGQPGMGNRSSNQGLGGTLGDLMGDMGRSLGRAGAEVRDNPVAAGGLGALVGSLLGGGRDSVKGALGGGALGMLASVAMQALGNLEQARETHSTDPSDALLGKQPPAVAHNGVEEEAKAKLLLHAMVSAAKADGHIDPSEMDRILGKARAAGADTEVQSWLLQELGAPLDLDALVAAIPNQEVAAEVYTASLLAIRVDTDEERDYLSQLANACGLSGPVVAQIHTALGIP